MDHSSNLSKETRSWLLKLQYSYCIRFNTCHWYLTLKQQGDMIKNPTSRFCCSRTVKAKMRKWSQYSTLGNKFFKQCHALLKTEIFCITLHKKWFNFRNNKLTILRIDTDHLSYCFCLLRFCSMAEDYKTWKTSFFARSYRWMITKTCLNYPSIKYCHVSNRHVHYVQLCDNL